MNGLIFIQLFFKKKINCWPRGLPLNEINNNKIEFKNLKKNNFYLQQGVCEGNPDVDAIFRLINKRININFKKNLNINVKKSLVTLNSQNTIWFRKIFPLLYLPVTCHYEMYRYLEGFNYPKNFTK